MALTIPSPLIPSPGICRAFYKQRYLLDFKMRTCFLVYFKFPDCPQYNNIKTESINVVWFLLFSSEPEQQTKHNHIPFWVYIFKISFARFSKQAGECLTFQVPQKIISQQFWRLFANICGCGVFPSGYVATEKSGYFKI